jgi:Pectate lyase superfamily protein
MVEMIPKGDEGDPGLTGPQGPPGGGVYHGPYDNAHPYIPTDICKGSDGFYYQNISGCTGVDPVTDTDESNWIRTIPRSVLTNERVGWFDVTDYGAKGDAVWGGAAWSGTDDTAAIQAAIDACITAGGGTVYFPYGSYLVDGALQTAPSLGTGTFYSQITLNTTGTDKVYLELTGPRRLGVWSGDSGPDALGPYLVSTSAGDVYATKSALPSVIGGKVSSDLGGTVSQPIVAQIHNLGIVTPDNPKLAAINLLKLYACDLDGLSITTNGMFDAFATTPTNSTGIGILMPGLYSRNSCALNNTVIEGYYQGLVAGEHTSGSNILIDMCLIGVGWSEMQHNAWFGYLDIERCSYCFAFNDYTAGSPGGPTTPPVRGFIMVDSFDFEQSGAGRTFVAHVADTAHKLFLSIRSYRIVSDGTPAEDRPLILSGTNNDVFAENIGNPIANMTVALLAADQTIGTGANNTKLTLSSTAATFFAYPAGDMGGFSEAKFDGIGCWAAGNPTRLTAPCNGMYRFEVFVRFPPSAGGTYRRASLMLGGSTTLVSGQLGPNASSDCMVQFSATLPVAAGDYLEIQAEHDAGTDLTLLAAHEQWHVGETRIIVTRVA